MTQIERIETNINTQTDVFEYIIKLTKEHKIEYIQDKRKESCGLSKLMECELSSEQIKELIKKAIAIKEHSKYKSDRFWQGFAITISDIASYKDKIINAYRYIEPSIVGGQTTGGQTFLSDHNHSQNQEKQNPKTWEGFIAWLKNKGFTDRTINVYSTFKQGLDYTLENGQIKIHTNTTNINKMIAEKYLNQEED